MTSSDIPWFGADAPLPNTPPLQDQARNLESSLLVRHWRVVLRRRWLILAIVAATLTLGLVGTLLMTPKYTASVTLEISRQQDRVVKVDEVEPDSSFVDQEFYQTQYSLLEARTLAEAVATELRLAQDDEFFAMFGEDPDNEGIFSGTSTGRLTRDQRAVRQREAVKILLEHISISPTRGSRLVKVGFTSPDAQLSTKVANAWVSNFIKQTLARRYEASSYARDFLEQRLDQLRNRLESSERDVVTYAENQGIINVPTGATATDGQATERSLVAENLAALNDELTVATADRIKALSRASSTADASREALSNQAISGLREQRAEVSAAYAQMLSQFEPNYPPVEALAAQLKQLDRSIAIEERRVARSLGSELASATSREQDLQKRVNGLKAELLDQRRRSIQYNIYQREADTNRELYNGLLQRYKEIGVAGGVGSNNTSIIDPATPPEKPSSPRIAINLLLSFLAGLGLGVAIAFLLEQIDEAIRDPSEVPEMTGLPLLGTIPVVEGDEDMRTALLDQKSAQSEAYLSIRTMLQFTTDHGIPRSLTITSTRSSEGKSTTALALAQSLARTGRSVILVDSDMRSPSVHHMMEADNNYGTSNYLSGDDDLGRLIRPSAIANLSFMSAGPQPPNAGELMSGPRLNLLFDVLEKKFDFVVFDSPPVLGLADAILIGSRAEAVIYAVEANSARRGLVQMALRRLQQSGVQPIGVILTKFEANKSHYGYGYDYGYGYGEGEKLGA